MPNKVKPQKSGLKKIKGAPISCFHQGHEPPKHMVLVPGTYENICPNCGHSTKFTVPAITS